VPRVGRLALPGNEGFTFSYHHESIYIQHTNLEKYRHLNHSKGLHIHKYDSLFKLQITNL
jgi:hypothetical protein